MSAPRAEIEILADPAALAERVADWMARIVRPKKERVAICLSGGSTPHLLYRTFATRKRIPWRRVHWFWGDERFVPPGDPMSNFHMAETALLSRAPVPASNIHPVRTEGVTPAGSAALYEAELQSFYGAARLEPARPLFDVTLLGLGIDGHTASLFPGSPALEERTRWTAAVEGQTPRRVTLTYPALGSSAHVAFLVAGAEKRRVLRELWQGDSNLPAARLRPEGQLHFFVDAAAAG